MITLTYFWMAFVMFGCAVFGAKIGIVAFIMWMEKNNFINKKD